MELSAHHFAGYEAWYPEALCFCDQKALPLETVLKAALDPLEGMHTCSCTSATDRGPSQGTFNNEGFQKAR
jgi:hypothetical protein